ncbi:glutathione S-transferase family protein [Lutibaculum baratangense]|nr:glutathione S-transferase family protein [Lutibaculum baratangense]
MKLYWCPHTRSFSILWLMEEAGLPYERVLVDIHAGEQRKETYLSINPMGKVPALVDGETVVAEQGAICAYVADRYPESGLAPRIDEPSRGRYLEWLFFAGSCIEPAFMEKVSGWEVKPTMSGWGNYDRVVAALERALAQGPWVLGERFSAADIMIGSGVHFGLAFGMLDKKPVFTAYEERLVARPAFQRAHEIDEAGAVERVKAS